MLCLKLLEHVLDEAEEMGQTLNLYRVQVRFAVGKSNLVQDNVCIHNYCNLIIINAHVSSMKSITP